MMALKKSLNSCVPWHLVLHHLHVETCGFALPQRVVCPLCSGRRLMIYADQVYGGAWASCRDCRFSGDMIELFAQARRAGIPSAVSRLRRLGVQFPADDWGQIDVATFTTSHIERRKRCRDLVAQGGRDLVLWSATIWDIVGELGLDLSGGGRIRRMGGFAVATDAVEINKLVRPHVTNQTAATSGGGRVLRGRRWRELLAIPCWDLPHRLSGFLLLGWPQDRLEQRSMSLHASRSITRRGASHPPIEAGLAMYPALFDDRRPVGNSSSAAFIFLDPLAALRLQSRHLRDHSIPLPLVGAIDTDLPANGAGNVRHVASRSVFDTLGHRRPLVFCGDKLTPALLRMAARANGQIWIGQAPRRRFNAWPWLKTVERQAKPWRGVLVQTMVQRTQEERNDFVEQVGLSDSEWRLLLGSCDAFTRQALCPVPQLRNVIESAFANGHTIVETGQGWFERDTGQCVSTAKLRINRVYSPANGGAPYYAGKILQGDAEIPFLSPMDEVDRQPFKWMTRKLLARGHPPPEYLSRYAAHATQIAIQLHMPQLRANAGRFGFDRRTWRIVLPQFTIDIRGQLTVEQSPIWDDTAPATDLAPPAGIPDQLLEMMTQDMVANKLFWATAAYIAANILCAAHGPRPKPIGFVGKGAHEIGGATAAALGCASLRLPSRPNSPLTIVDVIAEATALHNWPVLIRLPPRLRRGQLTLWLNWHKPRNAVLDADMTPLLPVIEDPGKWHIVRCDENITRTAYISECGPLLLSNWLLGLGRRKFQLLPHRVPLHIRVLEDFAQWTEGRGNSDVIRASAAYWDG